LKLLPAFVAILLSCHDFRRKIHKVTTKYRDYFTRFLDEKGDCAAQQYDKFAKQSSNCD